MDSAGNDSCQLNLTNLTEAELRVGALINGAPNIACLLLNLVGLTAEFVFVCRKKNTFLLRLFLYLSAAVTLSVAGSSIPLVVMIYFWPKNEFLCKLVSTLAQYLSVVESSFVFSVSVVLLYIVITSCMEWKNVFVERISKLTRKCFEALFVALNFGVPAVALSAFLGFEREAGFCGLTFKHSVECFFGVAFLKIEFLAFEVIPTLLNFILGVSCACVLLVWLCWLRIKLLTKAQMKTVIKEVGAWLVFFLFFCTLAMFTISIIFLDNNLVKLVASFSIPFLHSTVFIMFFIYVCVSLRCCHSRKKAVSIHRKGTEHTIQAAGQQTTPASTRVSLPTDTAAHAPNFLSPSTAEPTENSPLLT